MAAPTFQAAGAVVRGVGALTVAWPAHAVDDVALLFVETANQAATLTTANGFAAVTNQGTGTGGTAGATALYVFWCRATSTSQASPVVADSGLRQTAFILTFRGCITSGNPWDVFAGAVAASSASVSMPSVTTTVVDTLIVNAFSNPQVIAAPTVRPTSLANVNLSSVAARINTQADGTGGTVTGGFLPVGLFSFGSGGPDGDVGEGPDLTTATPCTACMFVPNISTIGAQIRAADAGNILLILNMAGNKQSYTTTVNGVPTLDMAKYTNNLRKFRPDSDNTAFADRLLLADAIRRRRVICYVVDEPNLTTSIVPSVPNITVQQANQMALLHKTQWAGYEPLTAIRVPAETMRSGWLSSGVLTGDDWTGVDYCWSQYTTRHGRGAAVNQPWSAPLDPQAVMDEQYQIIADNNLNMGVIPSLNLYSGGIGQNSSLGVTAAWDTNNSGGGTPGWVTGINATPDATEVTVLLDSYKSVMANPDWIKKFAQVTAADPECPCLLFWQHTDAGSASDQYINFYQRADMQAALAQAITTGLTRTTFNGWRTAK